ncbi:MAG TPA: hypothetical protein VJT31_28400 [Rugosimonospora sp.]|nr:hypothetical protein [Rugosimonospora sp.]
MIRQIDTALAAVSSPMARLAVALAAVRAARPNAILAMRVDGVGLGDHVLTGWLEHRRTRWPTTANPDHLGRTEPRSIKAGR